MKLLGICAVALCLIQGANAQSHIAPPIVISSDANMGTIWAQDRAGAPATNSSVSLRPVTSGSAATAAVNATGGNLHLGASAVAQPSSIVVQGNVPCPSVAQSWTGTDGVSVCNGTPPQTPNGGSASVIDTLAPTTGSATLACNAGTWQVTGTPSCQTSCAASVQSWVGSATCAASFPALFAGQSATLASTNGNTGSAQFTCNAGAWQLTGNGGCTAPSRACYWNSSVAAFRVGRTGANDTFSTGTAYMVSAMYGGSTVSVIGHGGSGFVFTYSAHRGHGVGVQYVCNNGTMSKAGGMYVSAGPSNWSYVGAESVAQGSYTEDFVTSANLAGQKILFVHGPRAFYSPY